MRHAVGTVVPEHVAEVRGRRVAWIAKTRAAVHERLRKEIAHWDHRTEELKLKEQAGKPGARLNSLEARRRADDLQARLQRRLADLDREAQISAQPPVIVGAFLVVPAGLLAALAPHDARLRAALPPTTSPDTQAAAAAARAIVMAEERRLGFEPVDRETERLGYDIESRVPGTGRLRFIEVKGRISDAYTISVTRNEVLTSLNKPEAFVLAMVAFGQDDSHEVRYLRRPFAREPDFGVTSLNYAFSELWARGEAPS